MHALRFVKRVQALEFIAPVTMMIAAMLRDNQDENRATIRMRMDCRRQTEVRA